MDREAGDAALATYAELYGQVERKLFAEVAAGRSAAPLKRDYIREHGIPARLFNAVRVSLEGKVSAVRAAQRLRVDSLERRIAPGERQVAQAEEQGRWQQVHEKRRRLANLRSRLAGLETDIGAGRVRLCFGSKRLWRKQHHLEANGYASHEEWLQDWRDARSNEFFVLGSRDETSGCQLCVASIADDGSLTLRLRMPDCLAEQHGKYLVIEGVRFAYGHGQVLAALASNAEYVAYRREHGDQAARATALGQAISYRFKRDGKGWRVFATTELPEVAITTDRRRGAIGVDLNADHLAVAETDASGNYLNAWRVPLVTYGKSQRQSEALIGDAVASVVEYAREVGKPIVIGGWTSARRRLSWRASPAGTPGCCPVSATARSRRGFEVHQFASRSSGRRDGLGLHAGVRPVGASGTSELAEAFSGTVGARQVLNPERPSVPVSVVDPGGSSWSSARAGAPAAGAWWLARRLAWLLRAHPRLAAGGGGPHYSRAGAASGCPEGGVGGLRHSGGADSSASPSPYP